MTPRWLLMITRSSATSGGNCHQSLGFSRGWPATINLPPALMPFERDRRLAVTFEQRPPTSGHVQTFHKNVLSIDAPKCTPPQTRSVQVWMLHLYRGRGCPAIHWLGPPQGIQCRTAYRGICSPKTKRWSPMRTNDLSLSTSESLGARGPSFYESKILRRWGPFSFIFRSEK